MANRYTQVQANRYNPLSMQEMAFAPTILRQQHDALEDKSDELGLFENNYLSSDSETINPLIENYKQEIDSFSDKLNKEGFNSMSRSDIRKLASKKRNLENEYINKSRANKEAMAKYAEQMQKTKGWSPEEVNRFIGQQTAGFKSFGEDGQYNQFSGSYLPNYVDEGKWIDDKLKNINYDEYGITPQEIQTYGGLPQFVNAIKSGRVQKLPLSKLMGSLISQAKTDPELTKYLTTKNQLSSQIEKDPLNFGNFDEEGKFTPNSRFGQRLYGAAFGKQFTRDKSKVNYLNDKVGFKNYINSLKDEVQKGTKPSNAAAAESINLYDEQFINELDDRYKYVRHSLPEEYKNKSGTEQRAWLKNKSTVKQIKPLSEMSPQVRDEVNKYVRQYNLTKSEDEPFIDVNNPEHLNQALDNIKQNAKTDIQPNIEYYDKDSESTRISDERLLVTKLMKKDTKLFDRITREYYTVDQLIANGSISSGEDGVTPNDYKKSFYLMGQASDNNPYASITNDESFGKPYEVKIGDKVLLMPGLDSETGSDTYKQIGRTSIIRDNLKKLHNSTGRFNVISNREFTNGEQREEVREMDVKYKDGKFIVEDVASRSLGENPSVYRRIYSFDEFKKHSKNYKLIN